MLNVKKVLTKILKRVDDSGWQNATLDSNFQLYGASTCQYRKVGNIVEIYGIVSPKSTIAGSDTNYTIFTLPDHYHPGLARRYIMQGSGNSTWLLTIMADGRVCFGRYRDHSLSNGTGYSSVSSSTWLPFNITFICTDYTT